MPATFMVTTGADNVAGSFRQALLDTNANPGVDTIAFDIGSGGVQTILPTTALPQVTDAVIIDGTTQPGYAGSPIVVLNGSQAGTSANGLTISAGDSTVRGLVVNSFYYANGIILQTNGGNHIAGNFIGTDVTGSITGDFHIGEFGVTILSGTGNVIGGTSAADRNVISAYPTTGIYIGDSGTKVQGNYIGTDFTGTHRLVPGDTWWGQGILVNAPDNLIGGTEPGAGNLISGVASAIGVNSGSDGNQIQGNFIGTDVTGTLVLGNRGGITMSYGNSIIGGSDVAARNIISGSEQEGVNVNGFSNRVEGNYIGTDVTGSQALGNGAGVVLAGTNNSLIGNLISGNLGYGAIVSGSAAVQANLIGTDASGTAAVPNNAGIAARSSGVVIGGTMAETGNLISGNTGAGVEINGQSVVLRGNRIGTNMSGTGALGNGTGIFVISSNGTVIGGTSAGSGNLISGNRGDGIAGRGQSVEITGNFIGTNATGTAALGNGGSGIDFTYAEVVVIGGSAAGRNVISGNALDGIYLGDSSSYVRVQSNLIGTNWTGTAALGNGGDGIHVNSAIGFGFNLVGGTTADTRNVISGNALDGLHFEGSLAGRFKVMGNYVGTDTSGMFSLPNLGSGVFVNGGIGLQIGGTDAGAGNVISGNLADGIVVASAGNQVLGNRIGTAANGSLPVSNGRYGVNVTGSMNEVGGSAARAGNTIAFNGSAGVGVLGEAAVGNRIEANSIHSNGGLGIDLQGDGVTSNDPGDRDLGPNRLQNFPIIAKVTAGASTHVTGSLKSAADTAFTLDFYATAITDSSEIGQGARYLGSAMVTTDADGNTFFDLTFVPSLTTDEYVTATATDPADNTSEFSPAVRHSFDASIDIKPADPVNVVDLNSTDILAVAVLTTSDCDAANIDASDLARIRFGDVTEAGRVSPDRETLGDVDGDGKLDRVFVFSIANIQQTGALNATSNLAELTGVTFHGLSFRGVDSVTVIPFNHAPAVITNNGLLVNQGEAVLVTAAALSAIDPDGVTVTYSVVAGPTHGTLKIGGSSVTSFTQADIDNRLLSYVHDGFRTTIDAFTVVVSDGSISSSPVSVAITINTAPAITLQPIAVSVFTGTVVTFAAAADGSPAPTVQWQIRLVGSDTFTDVTGATSPALSFKAASVQDGAQYRAVFTNAAGTATTNAVALNIKHGLVIVNDPMPQAMTVGTTATFVAVATGAQKPKIQWQVSQDGGVTFSNIPGASRTSLQVKALATVDGNLYRALFSNAVGSAVTDAGALTVNYSVTVAGVRKTLAVPVGTEVSFTGIVTGISTPSVLWEVSVDHGNTYSTLAGSFASTLTFTAGAAENGKYFRAVFATGSKVRKTAPIILTVGYPPMVTIPSIDVTVAPKGTASFSLGITGTPVVTVQWQVSTDGGKTFTNISRAMKPTLTIKSVNASMNGYRYRAVLANAFDQSVTPTSILTVI